MTKKSEKIFVKKARCSLLGTRRENRLFKKIKEIFVKTVGFSLLVIRKGGTDMDRDQNRPPGHEAPDGELIDLLIAVSVVAKRLAEKLGKQNKETRHAKLSG